MFVFIRAVIYSTIFIACLLVFIPARIVESAGLQRPAVLGAREVVGFAAIGLGAAIAGWCILTFALVGQGTPAPFDPPRRLVVRGPYRFVRNPMYLGAGLSLVGAAWVYRSLPLLAYLVVLALVTQALVVWYEEPALSEQFGEEYATYRRAVRRWLPRLTPLAGTGAT